MSTIRATFVQHGSSSVPNITLNASGQVIVASGIVSSGTFAAPSGSAAAPGVYFDGDTDTGLYSPGANQVALSTSGTGRLFVDANGFVQVLGSIGNLYDYSYYGPVESVSITSGGSGYTDGVYSDAVFYTDGNLWGFRGDVTVSGGAITDIVVQRGGRSETHYVGAVLTLFSDLGPGTGFSATVASVRTARLGYYAQDNRIRFSLADTTTATNQEIGAILFSTSDTSNSYYAAGDSARIYGRCVGTLGGAKIDVWTAGNGEQAKSSHEFGTGGTSSYMYLKTNVDSNAAASLFIEAIQNSRNGGGIYFGRENALDWSASTANCDGFISFSPVRDNVNQEAARLTSSGQLLVGTSTSVGNGNALQVYPSNNNSIAAFFAGASSGGVSFDGFRAQGSKGSESVVLNGNGLLRLRAYGYSGAAGGYVQAGSIDFEVDGTPDSAGDTTDMPGRLVFSTTADGESSPTERMRIASTGELTISANIASWSQVLLNDGNDVSRYGLRIQCGRDDATGTNYAVAFQDGDNTNQGYITFSGGTVTYGTFTAYHPCILPDADNEAGYAYGTLLEITSIEYTQKDGQDTERGILYNVRKTQAANSRAVLGAYGSSMTGGPDGETNRHQALVLGDGHILCNNSGGNIKVGDGICSSATPGIGQKATATPSMVIGIAQEDVTFADDQEVKLVPVQYGVRQFIPWGD